MEMKNIRRFSLSPVTVSLILAFLVLTAGFGVRASSWLAGAPSTHAEHQPKKQEKEKPVPMEREVVVIRPWGFEPTSLNRPPGPFILDVRNTSGLREVSLRLDSATGPRMQETRMFREKLNWRSAIDLPPGIYFLTAEGYPKWSYKLEITDPRRSLEKDGSLDEAR
jgi:hypothetical protein